MVDPALGSTGLAKILTTSSGYYATGSWWYETITGQNTSGFQWGYDTNGFTGYNVGKSGDWNYFPTANVRCVRNGP